MHYFYKPNKDSPPQNSYPLMDCKTNNDCKKLEVPEKFRNKIIIYCSRKYTLPSPERREEGICV